MLIGVAWIDAVSSARTDSDNAVKNRTHDKTIHGKSMHDSDVFGIFNVFDIFNIFNMFGMFNIFDNTSDDDMSRVSVPLLAAYSDIVGSLMGRLSNMRQLPFLVKIPSSQAGQVQRFWNDLFGGWTEPGSISPPRPGRGCG